MSETFKPIPVCAPSKNKLLFIVRCFFDLQMLTVFRFLAKRLSTCKGRILDVGAGESPWRELLSSDSEYVAVDIEAADSFGMQRLQGIDYYDGKTLPYGDATFDYILCTEVLEHVADPVSFLKDIHRVLRSDGEVIMTIPWSARLHHLPHDYVRFTRPGLQILMEKTGFSQVLIEERGNDIAVIANKLIVLLIRLLRPSPKYALLWTWVLAVLLIPPVALFLLAAHLALFFKAGSPDDPLGYGLTAIKNTQ